MTEPRQDTVEKVDRQPDAVLLAEMGRIRNLFTYSAHDKEDLITYAKEIVRLRAAINAMSDVREALDWRQVQIETRRHAGLFVDRCDIEAVLKGIAALNSLSGGGK